MLQLTFKCFILKHIVVFSKAFSQNTDTHKCVSKLWHKRVLFDTFFMRVYATIRLCYHRYKNRAVQSRHLSNIWLIPLLHHSISCHPLQKRHIMLVRSMEANVLQNLLQCIFFWCNTLFCYCNMLNKYNRNMLGLLSLHVSSACNLWFANISLLWSSTSSSSYGSWCVYLSGK